MTALEEVCAITPPVSAVASTATMEPSASIRLSWVKPFNKQAVAVVPLMW